MWRTVESKIGSYAGRIAPPGMPNITSTPSDSKDRTSDWAPVTDSVTTGLAAAGVVAGPVAGAGWVRTPAATVRGEGVADGRGVGCSAGVFVMTMAFGSVGPCVLRLDLTHCTK